MYQLIYENNSGEFIKIRDLNENEKTPIEHAFKDLVDVKHYLVMTEIIKGNYKDLSYFINEYGTDKITKMELFSMVNRQFVNYINSFVSYNNFVKDVILRNPKIEKGYTFNLKRFSTEYPIYKLLIKLRNYAVHCDLPIQTYDQVRSDFLLNLQLLQENAGKDEDRLKEIVKLYMQQRYGDNNHLVYLSEFIEECNDMFNEMNGKLSVNIADAVMQHLNLLIDSIYNKEEHYLKTYLKNENNITLINQKLNEFIEYILVYSYKYQGEENAIVDFSKFFVKNRNYFPNENEMFTALLVQNKDVDL